MKLFYRDESVEIWHGDMRDYMSGIREPRTIDHVLTDPPYSDWVHAKHRVGLSRRLREFGFDCLTPELRHAAAEIFAALARRWVIVFCDLESFGDWKRDLEAASLDWCRAGTWERINGTPQFTGDRPANGSEGIAMAHRPGRKRWNGGGKQAVYRYPIVVDRVPGKKDRLHTAQKPIGLMKALVLDFTDPGETILDPFMGSGTTLRAAKDLGRRAIGVEVDERCCELAAERMSQGVLDVAT